jgi:hypothetical protein
MEIYLHKIISPKKIIFIYLFILNLKEILLLRILFYFIFNLRKFLKIQMKDLYTYLST